MPIATEPTRYEYLSIGGRLTLDDRTIDEHDATKFAADLLALAQMHGLTLVGSITASTRLKDGRIRLTNDLYRHGVKGVDNGGGEISLNVEGEAHGQP